MMMLSFYSIQMMAVCGRQGSTSSNKLIIHLSTGTVQELKDLYASL